MGYANGYERLVPIGCCQTIDHVHSIDNVTKGRVNPGWEKSKLYKNV